MPTVYRRKPGSRHYKDYTEEQLKECLNAIKNKELTQRAAAVKYRIPRSTIKIKLRNFNMTSPGRPTVFGETEEQSFVAHITALSEYGFPLCELDLVMIVRDYLQSQGRQVKQFNNNVPGKEWVKNFLRRHKRLTTRFANNIKRVRAQVSQDIISNYIDRLAPELDGVPPENIYNYDETNLCDDPGKKKIICRRGTKYPEHIMNSTKISFSVMFCGNAAGESIPPYIIYKSEHLWSTWMENGPDGTRYNRTKSGWIDSATFEDWFLRHLLPILKKKSGRKVIIGDNLASHINFNVLEECGKNNIAFICLPPNATHILQPLDVAYFRPLKVKWRQVLMTWKESQVGRKLTTTPKEIFPGLLKKALDNLPDTRENLIAGFKKTGIVPLNKNDALERLPKQDRVINLELITGSFLKKLESSRAGDSSVATKVAKKKKLNVPAGKSISLADIIEAGPSGEQKTKQGKKQKRTRCQRGKKNIRFENSSTSCSDSNISLASSTEDLIVSESDQGEDDELPLPSSVKKTRRCIDIDQVQNAPAQDKNRLPDPQLEDKIQDIQPQEKPNDVSDPQPEVQVPQTDSKSQGQIYNIGDHVIVRWDSRIYPGEIIAHSEEGATVSCMKRGIKFWKWPKIKDEEFYRWHNIISKINAPKFLKKGSFHVPEIDNFS